MQYTKQEKLTGAWVKASELVNGAKAKIVEETKPRESAYEDKDGKKKMQNVTKIRVEGVSEPLNVNINKATLGGLIDAFGTDSLNWIDKPLRIETEKMRIAGKAVTALYLIPDGFRKVDDEDGYAVIEKIGPATKKAMPKDDEEQEISSEDIPF